MLELAKKNRYGSFWTVSRFISVLVFCCQQSHAATIYSLDSSIWAKASAPENVYRVPQTVQVKYSAGLMLLPEWDHEPGESIQIAPVKLTSASLGDISLTVAKINLQVSREEPLENLRLGFDECSSSDLVCEPSNILPLTALAWLFAPGILGLIGVHRRVWESGDV